MENEQGYKKQLTDYISKQIELTEVEKSLIANAYSVVSIPKKKHIFKQGEPCQVEAFVVKGTFRSYYCDEKGLEHVLFFSFQDWWLGDIASFNSGEKSNTGGQALENSIALVINPETKEKLFQQVPKLERLFRIITQKHLTVLQKRFLLTVSSNASERYLELLARSPGIEQLVPQHQIASYLGILPESLSRMKKQMLK